MERAPIRSVPSRLIAVTYAPRVERERLSRALFANGASRPRSPFTTRRGCSPTSRLRRARRNAAATKLDLTDSGGGAGGAVLPWVDLMANARRCASEAERMLGVRAGAKRVSARRTIRRNPSATRARRVPFSQKDFKDFSPRGFRAPRVLELGAARLTTSTCRYDLGPSGVSFGLLFRLLFASRDQRRELGRHRRARNLSLGAFRRERDGSFRILTRLGIAPETLVGTLFCKRGEPPLRVLRCAKPAGQAAAVSSRRRSPAFFVESSDDALPDPRCGVRRGSHQGPNTASRPGARLAGRARAPVRRRGPGDGGRACHGTAGRLAIAGSAVTDAGAACALARLSPFTRVDRSNCRGC